MKNLTIQQVKEATQKAAKDLGLSEKTFNSRFTIKKRAELVGKYI
jgi:hypothetical protein